MSTSPFLQMLKTEVGRMQAVHPEREGEIARALPSFSSPPLPPFRMSSSSPGSLPLDQPSPLDPLPPS